LAFLYTVIARRTGETTWQSLARGPAAKVKNKNSLQGTIAVQSKQR